MGWELQRRGKRVRRPDVTALRRGQADPRLSGCGGLPAFAAFLQKQHFGASLRQLFGHLKTGAGVVYPMHTQLQLLIDAFAVGARRVFDFERLAADPIFVHLAGGAVPSIDVLYDDLRRFEAHDLEGLEALLAEQALHPLRDVVQGSVTLDVDTTVMPLFGSQEGALPGPNPRYHGRPSYHPILARIAETDTLVGARLRPGNTGLGEDDIEDVEQWIDRVREVVGPRVVMTVRLDAGGDCGSLLEALDKKGVHFIIKAKQTPRFLGAAVHHLSWTTVDQDADGAPSRQVAVLDVKRDDWPAGRFRVIAVRSNDRFSGRQTCLWDDLDHSVQFFVTNDLHSDPSDIAWNYDARAGIEGTIRELKQNLAIGAVSTDCFDANEAAFLLKILTYNLLRRWIRAEHTEVIHWSISWSRTALLCVPARLLRSGGRWELRIAPHPLLN